MAVKETTQTAALVLNEEKVIRGKKIKAGTTLAEVKCSADFIAEDVDLGLQLNQVKLVPVFPKKNEK